MEAIFYSSLLALVEQDGFKAVRKSTSRGGQLNGSCPFCKQGHDRFRVQPEHGPYGWYACSVCDRRGNAITYLMEMRGFTKQEALLAVGWKPKDGSEPHFTVPASALDERPQWDEPGERWQYAAHDFACACQKTLWSDAGRAALDYLRARGLKDGTIKFAMLGYHPHEAYGAAHTWGRSRAVKLWQGIVIPWFYQGALWRLTIRDERVISGDGRYKQVSGGSNGLYLADSLALKRPVVVTEGEFDALSVAQECGRRVAVVATGTTQGGHTPRWIGLLERQQRALIAFDGEEKGDIAASWWLSRLSNAQRLRPLWKDANQMLQDGWDLGEWIVEGGIDAAPASAHLALPTPVPEPEPAQVTPQEEPATPEHEQTTPPAPPAQAPVQRPANPNAPNVRSDGTRCLTQIYLSEKHPRHVGFPSWIDPKANNFPGWDVRNSYLRGETDVMGNWWCGMCFFRCQLINRGAILGYPELPPGYRIEGYPSAGYGAWLALAQYGGSVCVETAVRWVFAPADLKWRVVDYGEQARAVLALQRAEEEAYSYAR